MRAVSVALCFAVFMVSGCSREAKVARHLARGGQYFQGEKYREAAIEYMNVLKVEPMNAAAIRGMGLSLYEMGEVRAAVPCLLKAEEMDPNDGEVRLKMGALYLIMGDRSQARSRAEFVLGRSPESLDALVLWGASVTSSNEAESAIERLVSHRAKFQDQPKYYVTLASLYASKGDVTAADEVYQAALRHIPKSWEIRLARGDLYQLRGDAARAGEEYQAAADLSPAGSMARVKLARFRWATGAKVEAKQILEELLRQSPRFSAAALFRAEISLSERDYGSAAKMLGAILKDEPSNLEAFLLMQRVKLAEGKDDEAIAAYEKLVLAFPKAAQARYLLATAWLHKGDTQKAISECERAIALAGDHLESIRLLGELYIRTGQADQAIALLKPVIGRRPREGGVLVLLGAAYSAKKDYLQAAGVYKQVMSLMPDSPQGAYLLGSTLRRLGRDGEAVEVLEEALTRDPTFAEALDQLVGIMAARDRKWDAAVTRIRKQLEKAPEAAGVHYLLGNTLLQKGVWDQAEVAFKKAVELKPDITAAYVGLSYTYVARHQEEQALAQLDKALAVNSNDVASLMMKGTLLMNRKEWAGAAAQYERILAINPSFVPALNNLACLYGDQPGRLDKAYEFARRARELAPYDFHVADTLGWLLVRRGEHRWALTLLQESADHLSSQPEVLYHLGMCQAGLGDAQGARASLLRARGMEKAFAGAAEANEMLAALDAIEQPAEWKTKEQVEGFLRRHAGNPFVAVRAGVFFEEQGDYERARSLYEAAIAKSEVFVPALTRLAALLSAQFNDPDRAMGLVKRARETAPGDPGAADTLAVLAFRKGDYKWAQSLLLESIRLAGPSAQRQFLLGMAYYALGKIDMATDTIDKVMGESPGTAYGIQAKEFLDAVRRPALIAQRVPVNALTNDLSVETLPVVMDYAKGIEKDGGDVDRARQLYERVIVKYPDFGPAFKRLAVLYGSGRSISEQEFKVLVRARELLPGDADVGRALANALFLRSQYEWAARLLQESSTAFPDDAKTHYYLGLSYHQLRNAEGAKKALRRALELDAASDLAPRARQVLGEIE